MSKTRKFPRLGLNCEQLESRELLAASSLDSFLVSDSTDYVPQAALSSSAASTGKVSGRVYLDVDEDGIKSPQEERLANWLVFVDENKNAIRDHGEPQQRTDVNGRYEFALPATARAYHISVELHPNFDNTTRLTRSIVIQSGVRKANKDFGVIRPNGVAGTVFLDTNRDGIQNGSENGLQGWTVFVDGNRNGRHDPGERRVATDKDGSYQLKSFQPGAHRILVLPMGNLEFTAKSARSVVIPVRGVNTERDFGVNVPRDAHDRPPREPAKNTAMISGRVFEDIDGDGRLDPNETGLVNWRVYVDANRNGRRDPAETSTRTDENGRYEFTLRHTVHRIGVEPRVGIRFTTNAVRSVNISDGQNKSGRHFGVQHNLSISGTIMELVTRTGRSGTGDESIELQPKTCIGLSTPACVTEVLVRPPVRTWTLFVDANRNGRHDVGERSATTDADGKYEFKSLAPAVHRIVLNSQTGYRIDGGSGRSVDLINNPSREDVSFNVRPKTGKVRGQVFVEPISFFQDPVTPLAGRIVYADDNLNGDRDPGETWTRTNSAGWYSLTLGMQFAQAGVHYITVDHNTHETIRAINTRDQHGVTYSVNITAERVVIGGKDFAIDRP